MIFVFSQWIKTKTTVIVDESPFGRGKNRMCFKMRDHLSRNKNDILVAKVYNKEMPTQTYFDETITSVMYAFNMYHPFLC